jgi:hypothetical protein
MRMKRTYFVVCFGLLAGNCSSLSTGLAPPLTASTSTAVQRDVDGQPPASNEVLPTGAFRTGASGQGSRLSSTERWRPKDGTYAAPDKHFDDQCGEFGDVILEFAEKAVLANERSCSIEKLRDTAPGAIRLDLICDDYNLAIYLGIPSPYDHKFREIMLVKKIDGDTISVRKTLDGKFTAPAWRASYCPEEKQRWYREAKERSKAEEAKKAAR